MAMIENLHAALQDDSQKKFRVILIRANGDKVFSSGHDLKELVSSSISVGGGDG